MKNNKALFKRICGGITAYFLVLTFVALLTKGKSQYANQPEEWNPMEGKKVVFAENDRDNENADGYRGHLEAVGEVSVRESIYEKYVKRILDITLSFWGACHIITHTNRNCPCLKITK